MPELIQQYLQPIWIAAIRHRGAHDPVLTDDTWHDLIMWASPRRMLGRAPDARGIGILWDDPRHHAPRDRRYDVGIPIDPDDVPGIGHPAFVLITPPGRYQCVTHEGPYERMFDTYAAAFDGPVADEGYELLAQPIIEVYRNSPSEVAASDLRTDIYLPLFKPDAARLLVST